MISTLTRPSFPYFERRLSLRSVAISGGTSSFGMYSIALKWSSYQVLLAIIYKFYWHSLWFLIICNHVLGYLWLGSKCLEMKILWKAGYIMIYKVKMLFNNWTKMYLSFYLCLFASWQTAKDGSKILFIWETHSFCRKLEWSVKRRLESETI